MQVANWMSWEGGVDLVAASTQDAVMPDVIVHIARTVNTPLGSSPAGMILIPNFEDHSAAPLMMGFVAANADVGAYFGPNIFAGTPFEQAPVITADIQIEVGQNTANAKITVGDLIIETRLSEIGEAFLINRPAENLPFVQQGVEANAGRVELLINGKPQTVFVPEIGMTGGYGAVYAATGVYAR
jgi:hypothetical protein